MIRYDFGLGLGWNQMFDAVGFPGDDKPATGRGRRYGSSSSSPSSSSAASSSKSSPKRGLGGLRSMRMKRGMKKGNKESASVRTAPKRGAGTLTDDCLFDATIFMGDLNYRLDLPRLEVRVYFTSCIDWLRLSQVYLHSLLCVVNT